MNKSLRTVLLVFALVVLQVGPVAHFCKVCTSSIFKNRPYSFVDRQSVQKNTACACLEAALRQPWRVVHEKQCVNKSSHMNQAAESKFATRE